MTTVVELLAQARQFWNSGQLEAADCLYQAAIHCESDSPRARCDYAEFQFRTERVDEAIQSYNALLKLAQKTGNVELTSLCHSNLAACFREQGDSQRSRIHQGHSLKSELMNGEFDQLAVDLGGQAVDAIQSGELDVAQELLLRSLALEQEHNNLAGQAADCGNLGVLAGLRGDFATGIRFLGRAYRIHREINDSRGAGADLVNLAEIFKTLVRDRLAEKCLRRAVICFHDAGAERSLRKAKLRLNELRGIQSILERDPSLN